MNKERSRLSTRAGGLRWARNQVASFERRLFQARGEKKKRIVRERYRRACIILMVEVMTR
jgi:hypothetical protein